MFPNKGVTTSVIPSLFSPNYQGEIFIIITLFINIITVLISLILHHGPCLNTCKLNVMLINLS